MIKTKEELMSLLKSYDEKISSLETQLKEVTTKPEPEPETTPTPEPETEPKPDETPEPEEKDLDEIEKLIQGGI